MRVIDLALKDLLQIVRDWKTALFLVAMPIVFTLFFGFVLGDAFGEEDPRLPVGYVDHDHHHPHAALRGVDPQEAIPNGLNARPRAGSWKKCANSETSRPA